MSNIERVLERLDGIQRLGGNKFKALCPVHSEKHASLSIKYLNDGRIIMHCFGCGANGIEVVHALGLMAEDLFPEKPKNERGGYQRERQAFSSSDILKLLLHEAAVLSAAAQMIGEGKPLSKFDIIRVEQARHRIDEAINYVNS